MTTTSHNVFAEKRVAYIFKKFFQKVTFSKKWNLKWPPTKNLIIEWAKILVFYYLRGALRNEPTHDPTESFWIFGKKTKKIDIKKTFQFDEFKLGSKEASRRISFWCPEQIFDSTSGKKVTAQKRDFADFPKI